MSLLSSVGSALTKTFYAVADPIITTVAHPFQVAKAVVDPNKTVKQVENQFFSQTKLQQGVQFSIGAVNAFGAATGIAAVESTGVKTAALALAKTGIKHPIASAVIPLGAIATEATIGKAPQQSFEIGKNTLIGLPNFATNVGVAVGDPSVENAKKVFTDNPVIAGIATGLGALGLYSVAKSGINAIATGENTSAINESNKLAQKGSNIQNSSPQVDYKAQAKAQIDIIEAQTKAQMNLNKQVAELQTPIATPVVAPSEKPLLAAPSVAKTKKKRKKSKKKSSKKKTRRSKKKSKKKKKTIKRRKSRR